MPLPQTVNGHQNKLHDKVGLVQWFHPHQHTEVEKALADFEQLGITHVRTPLSWADWQQQNGREWFDWLFEKIGSQLQVMPAILFPPATLGREQEPNSIAQNLKIYNDFIDAIIAGYGHHFEYIELCTPPNAHAAYGLTNEKEKDTFCEMISAAANLVRQKGKKIVLGGIAPRESEWLDRLFRKNGLAFVDVVGVQGYPGVFDPLWEGWEKELAKISLVLQNHQSSAEIWITEAGFSTWQKNEQKQLQEFNNAIHAEAGRVYWYGLNDQQATQPATNRNYGDERENYFGMKHADGSPKLLYTILSTKGLEGLKEVNWLTAPVVALPDARKYTLITGGAGFVGINLADRLLAEGKPVMVFDNLSRAGVQNNLFWLKEKYPHDLQIMVADIRDKAAVKQAVENAEMVFHFAAQVAVTSSLVNPFHDFEVNAQGTLNLLEAIRHTPTPPPVIFTSTNKVYGDLKDLGMVMNGTRYHPENLHFRRNGISEERNLDFHSPYGCSKGVADQYLLDYGRTFGLKTVVFRMSCIYGPHQFGTEDQGWVAHFLIQALKNKPITLYGDGKQVRDILFVEDLVEAFLQAKENIDTLSGHAFNIGGGVQNTVSLLELIELIGQLNGKKPEVTFNEWRPGDQKYYVSDFKKFTATTGWEPQTGTLEGVTRLYNWLLQNADVPARKHISASHKPSTKTNKEPLLK